jgi:E3 ubiquitin-protein ligase Mdm2
MKLTVTGKLPRIGSISSSSVKEGSHSTSTSNSNSTSNININSRMRPGVQEAIRVLANDYDLPGPFTVLQGMTGDGMANSINTMPDIVIDAQDCDQDDIHNDNDEDGGALSIHSNSNNLGHNSDTMEGEDHSSFASETSSLEVITHSQANAASASMSMPLSLSLSPQRRSSRSRYNRRGLTQKLALEQAQEIKKMTLSPRRDDQPKTGLHLPLPPGVPGLGFNSILPPVGIHLSPRNSDSFIMINGKLGNTTTIGENANTTNENENASQDSISPASSEGSDSKIDIGRVSPTLSRYGTISSENRKAIQQWNRHCRTEEKLKCDELCMHLTASVTSGSSTRSGSGTGASSLYKHQWWKGKRHHCLYVFDTLPEFITGPNGVFLLKNNVKLGNVIGELTPGTTIMGVQKFTLENPNINKEKSRNPHEGVVEVLQIESPLMGYVVCSVDGYPFIGSGLPSAYTEPDVWLWKVMCTNGAYVRQGLELTSVHVDTIPFGSFVRVTRKTINAMGLTRLQIEAYVTKKSEKLSDEASKVSGSGSGNKGGISSAIRSFSSMRRNSNASTSTSTEVKMEKRKIVGWISEGLNPLSGQTGPIVKSIPFPVPAQFRITLPDGAVIRQDVELSSNQIGHAPRRSILTIVGQEYSENPTDQCIQRLQLAGGGGWVSVALNRPLPSSQISVLEQIGIDGAFDPNEAGLFHIERQLMVIHEYNMNISTPNEEDRLNIALVQRSLRRMGSCVSSINDDDDANSTESSDNSGVVNSSAPVPALYRSGVAEMGRTSSLVSLKCGSKSQKDEPCLICLAEDRNATIVHGETGHIACCLACARLLKGRGDKCPVCRLPIDLIIQQFWA